MGPPPRSPASLSWPVCPGPGAPSLAGSPPRSGLALGRAGPQRPHCAHPQLRSEEQRKHPQALPLGGPGRRGDQARAARRPGVQGPVWRGAVRTGPGRSGTGPAPSAFEACACLLAPPPTAPGRPGPSRLAGVAPCPPRAGVQGSGAAGGPVYGQRVGKSGSEPDTSVPGESPSPPQREGPPPGAASGGPGWERAASADAPQEGPGRTGPVAPCGAPSAQRCVRPREGHCPP